MTQAQKTGAWELRTTFSLPVLVTVVVILILFGVFVRYDDEVANDAHVAQYYGYMRDVAFMIFVGFGFLMTFLRHYSYSAIGLNMLCAAIMVLEFIFVGGAVQQVIFEGFPHKIRLDLPLVIDALFASAAGMIAFGAVLGKATPSQILWLCIWQVPFYALNQHLVFESFKALDIGGSLSIHAFGAYYGLAASLFISKPGTGVLEHAANKANYVTDITSMIGTLFLWLYWPSFNGALGSTSAPGNALVEGMEGQQQFLCVVNTFLSLLGATCAVFAVSALVHGKLQMFHVQNATLAGGVAMGSAANLRISPVGALAVGICAGGLSTLGFGKVMPYLERCIGLRDTCGIHYLHGLPGLMGGLVAGIAAVSAYQSNEAVMSYSAGHQFGYQVLAMVVTVAIGAGSGAIGGMLATWVDPARQNLPVMMAFEDSIFWDDVEHVDDIKYTHAGSKHGAGASRHSLANGSKHSATGGGSANVQMVMDCLTRIPAGYVEPVDATVARQRQDGTEHSSIYGERAPLGGMRQQGLYADMSNHIGEHTV